MVGVAPMNPRVGYSMIAYPRIRDDISQAGNHEIKKN